MALDFHVNNVTCTYTLEHKSIDDLFNSISDCLNVLMEKEESTSKQLQELVFCIGTIQALICQHMLKEEKQVPCLLFFIFLLFYHFIENSRLHLSHYCIPILVQVFPLLMQQFSTKEQASLIWQFLCNVPIMLLEDFLPWLTSFLSPLEQEDILHCIKEVVPEEKLLQEVYADLDPFSILINIWF